jgi:hypothetical protein
MTADMQGAIPEVFFDTFDLNALKGLSSKDLEASGRITRPLYAVRSTPDTALFRGTRR